VDAEEAQRIGLVNRVIDGNPLDAAVAFAREFSGYSLPVLNFAREAVSTAMDHALNMGLRAERELGTLAFQTQDAREGISAFLEKRPAKFQDR
jgi:enoyl-CoA hydratase